MRLPFRPLFAGSILLFLLAVAIQTPALQVIPLRPDLMKGEAEGFRLLPEPDTDVVIASPAVRIDLTDREPQAPTAGIEIEFTAEAPGEFEMQAVYDGKVTRTLNRRSFGPTGGKRVVRWELSSIERVTSLTLSMRAPAGSPPAMVHRVNPRHFLSLPPEGRAFAFSGQPVYTRSAANPARDGRLAMRLAIPESLKPELRSMPVFVEIKGAGDKKHREPLEIPLPDPARKESLNHVDFEVALPAWATGSVRVEVQVENPEGVRPLGVAQIDLAPLDRPALEIPWRSIEDFAVIERNGELAVYTALADEGLSRHPGQAPLPGNEVWLTVGNGREWILSEAMMLGSRDIPWISGGVGSLNVGAIGEEYLGVFTSASNAGVEAFCVASSRSSLRLGPSAKNPVWMPAATDGAAPLWRGNAMFESGGGWVIAALRVDAGTPAVELLASPMQTRWMSLGTMPLPGLDTGARTISSWTDGDECFLLTGPKAQLFRAKGSSLRGWQPVEFDVAGLDWEKPRLYTYAGTTYFFGIKRMNGRGIVTWATAERDGNSMRVLPDKPFDPPALKARTHPDEFVP